MSLRLSIWCSGRTSILVMGLFKSLNKKGVKFIQNQVYIWFLSVNQMIDYKSSVEASQNEVDKESFFNMTSNKNVLISYNSTCL